MEKCQCYADTTAGVTLRKNKDGTHSCPKCGGLYDFRSLHAPTDYLAKARELVMDEDGMSCKTLDCCLPIVADLLKRVDELKQQFTNAKELLAINLREKAELEEELHCYGWEKARAERDRYKKLLEAIANDYETSEHLRKTIQQALKEKTI